MDAKLIIQMNGKKTGILNSKVIILFCYCYCVTMNLYLTRQIQEMKVYVIKNSHLIILIGLMMMILKNLHHKNRFIKILELK